MCLLLWLKPPRKIIEALKFLVPTEEEWQAAAWRMELEEGEARDNLLMVKHQQAVQANRQCWADPAKYSL